MRRLGFLSSFLAILLMCSCIPGTTTPSSSANPTPTITTDATNTITATHAESELQVIVLDVGQADCILLKTDDHTMLIDAGDIGQNSIVLNYLAYYGIKKLDYLVATHPHADHIGAMAAVVRAMDHIGTIIMPDATTTTNVFENLLDAIEEKSVPITIAVPGETFALGNAQVQIIAPNGTNYRDLNDFSVVLRVVFGDSVFLFTGDAETQSENEQLAGTLPLDADVLKVGHHGSRTSSTQRYLDAVSPRYAVISCGQGNSYGHPHSEAMSRLVATGAEIYRTDESSTIIFTTDGETITVDTTRIPPGTMQPSILPPNPSGTTYVGNINSKIFHLPTCGSLPQEQNRVYFATRDEATEAGFTPCSVCKP